MPPQKARRAGKTFEHGGAWVSHCPVVVDATGRIPSKGGGGVKIYLWLAFGCEGGGSSGSGVETIEKSPSGSHLDVREVVVVADALKGPPPARVRMPGRVEAAEVALKPLKVHLRLAFGHEGDGGVVGVSGVIVVSHCRFVLVVKLATSVGMGE